MNERIKELAGQSVVRFDKDMDGSMVSEEHGRWIRYEDLEKFAELIVKGCCDWIDGSPVTESGQLILTKSFIIANLKGYFGVEE